MKADRNCGYRPIVALLDMAEESWSLVRRDFFKELCAWRDEYAAILDGFDRVEELKKSLLVEGSSTVRIISLS